MGALSSAGAAPVDPRGAPRCDRPHRPNTLFTLGLEDLPVNIGGLLIALIPIATVGAAIGGALTRRFALELGGVILTERSSRHVPVPGADIAE